MSTTLGELYPNRERATEIDPYYTKLYDLLVDCKCVYQKPKQTNYVKIPLTRKLINNENIEWFNAVYQTILHAPEPWSKISRTKSGGISIRHINNFQYDLLALNHASFELTILGPFGNFRILMGKEIDQKCDVTGRQAYLIFHDICTEMGIDLDNYAVDNGKDIKATMEKPMIALKKDSYRGVQFTGAHHLDLNNSYMSGIAEAFPDLRPAIEEVQRRRQEAKAAGDKNTADKMKAILTHTYGFCQSQWCVVNGHGYAHANLSKAALDFNNNYIRDLAHKLESTGRRVIAYNTDGIWYVGDIYHDDREGTELGQWKNDHTNCKLRFRSSGAYEFMEDGKVTVVLRGVCELDKYQDRKDWQWGDLMGENARPLTFKFREGYGFYCADINNEWEM